MSWEQVVVIWKCLKIFKRSALKKCCEKANFIMFLVIFLDMCIFFDQSCI